ncbi:hypothetical protein SAMN05421776_11324 [Nocardia farcinica]|nr:hypothetical protein [Nocardia farcinica]PFW99370.1 hypothetical protein CJ469_05290 [Nocardia farcinica]PFX06781.1 hypothetical protein CJ468_04181 [Nocardia farcinica]SIT32499.1 hypothetical protein SAMN05421776_11324 [Nocardia farcinica]
MTPKFRWTAPAAVLASAALVVTGCSSGDSDHEQTAPPSPTTSFVTPTETTSRVPATPPSTPLPAPATLPAEIGPVDEASADAVAAAVARIWYGWDTTRDLTPHDAKLRAVPLLEPRLTQLLRDYPPIAGPGADWLDLTARSAILTVPAEGIRPGVEAGAPTDTATSAVRLLEVTQKVNTPTGPMPDRHLVVGIALVKVGAEWRVSQVGSR